MATTLLAGSATRTRSIPGAQLRTGDGSLLAGSVLRAPYVPGAFLSCASDADTITAVLYDRADLSAPVTTLSDSFARQWQDVLCEAGSGSIRLQNDDTDLALFSDDGRDIVALYYRGVLAFLLRCSRKREVVISPNGEGDEYTIYSGSGALDLFGKATVGPTGGGGRSPIEEDRHFGWASETYDHSGWGTVEVLGDIQTAINVIAFELSTDPDDIEDKVRQNLPFLDLIPVLGPPGSTMSLDATVGDWYVYEDATTNSTLTIPTDGDYFIYFGPIDDEGEFYVDGQQVATIAGLNVFGVTSAAITLSAGTHSVAAHIKNLDFTAGPNPTKYSWQITTEPTAASLVDPGGDSTVVASARGTAKCLAYPATVPGQTVTKTIRLAVEEAIDRDQLADIDLAFTDTNYTDGRTVEPIPDIGTKVGTKISAFLSELAGSYIDMRVRVVDGRLALEVFEKGTMGDTRTTTLDSTNVVSWEAESELHDTKKAWVRWDGGWTYLDTGTGDEDVIEIGAPASLEEVVRMATAALDEVNAPKTQHSAELGRTDHSPLSAATAPYTGFVVGDTVTGPTGSVRAVAIGMTEDPQTGQPLPSAMFGDLILPLEARLAQDQAKQ
jgi:hypothetical protein